MKIIIALLFVTVAFCKLSEDEYRTQFNSWANQYSRVYSNAEFQDRYNIFKSNLDFINKHNKHAKRHGFSVGLNAFADLTAEEFSKIYKGLTPRDITISTSPVVVNVSALPDTVDWRTKGAVTGVKNQGQCGSCWTFSSTGGIEGQWQIHGHGLVSLSEQQIVDCCKQGYGCGGGWMDWAFAYVAQQGGIDTESSYPYTARNGDCHYNAATVGARISSYRDVAAGSESALQNAVATVGPISVAIDASHSSFQFYNGGVYHEPACSTTALDHAVLAVGYGVDAGKDYWLVKNSWGTSWGLEGYIMMSRNANNNCGIASKPSYPLVA
eukprot:TRINITY_DN404_c0_g1_i7.p1 TRINITY_DN404_c0_g1~~TRINITY_DN404_c0_g1_i7.p1  ORF type:complete len:325 (-),score=72.09 TRINITY_DN404_c0_g1_i7:104-1078(-)